MENNTAHSLLKRYYDIITNASLPYAEFDAALSELEEEIKDFFKIKNPNENKYEEK